jgi:hypothetical protein
MNEKTTPAAPATMGEVRDAKTAPVTQPMAQPANPATPHVTAQPAHPAAPNAAPTPKV